MSNRIFRFGGSHIGNINSVNNLRAFLSQSKGRKLIAVSAIPELLAWIEKDLAQIFQSQLSSDELVLKISKLIQR